MADINRLLHTDGISEAEEITGKSYKTDPRTDALGFALSITKNRELNSALEASGDTTHVSTLDQYLAIIGDMGFRVVLEVPFVSDRRERRDERLIIAWDERRGALLHFDTWHGRKVNGGAFAFNWRCDPFYAERPYSERISSWWTGGGSHCQSRVPGHDDVDVFTLDCREAIRWKFARAEAVGRFVTPWVERPYLKLTHYQDWHETDHLPFHERSAIIDRVSAEREALLPDDVRRAIRSVTPAGRREGADA